MGCTYRYTCQRAADNSYCPGCFSTETMNRSELCQPESECFYYPPASHQCSKCDDTITRYSYPERNIEFGTQFSRGKKKYCDNSHGLLGIIRTMSQAKNC